MAQPLRVSKGLGYGAMLTDREQVDRPVSPAADVVDRGCRSTTLFANAICSIHGPLDGRKWSEFEPPRPPAAQNEPQKLAKSDLPLMIQNCRFGQGTAELAYKPGTFLAFFAAVRSLLGIKRFAATGASPWIGLDGLQIGQWRVDQAQGGPCTVVDPFCVK